MFDAARLKLELGFRIINLERISKVGINNIAIFAFRKDWNMLNIIEKLFISESSLLGTENTASLIGHFRVYGALYKDRVTLLIRKTGL